MRLAGCGASVDLQVTGYQFPDVGVAPVATADDTQPVTPGELGSDGWLSHGGLVFSQWFERQ